MAWVRKRKVWTHNEYKYRIQLYNTFFTFLTKNCSNRDESFIRTQVDKMIRMPIRATITQAYSEYSGKTWSMILCPAFISLFWVPEGTLLHRLLEVCFESQLTNEQCIALCMWMWDILTSLERSENTDAPDPVTYRAACSDYKERSRLQHDTCVLITEVWHTCAFLLHCMKLDSV